MGEIMTMQELETFFDQENSKKEFSESPKAELTTKYKMKEEFKPRLYQETIFAKSVEKNTLVVLPTGLGKTAIAMMLAAHRLKQYPDSKILILAPTRPLINQHLETFEKFLDIDPNSMAVFTGMISPAKREALWKEKQIILSTPQGLENDVLSSRVSLKDVSLLIIDEAHRAVGNYSYVFVAKQYQKTAEFPKILSLTASPGSDMDTLKDVTKNLYVENIESRTNEDPDVKPYIQEVKQEFIKVKLPESLLAVKDVLDKCYKSKLQDIKDYGFLKHIHLVSKGEILRLQAQLHGRIARGDKTNEIWKCISLLAEAMKISHAQELLETQGINPLFKYLDGIRLDARNTKTKATINLANDFNFKNALEKTRILLEQGIEHPKLKEVKRIISSQLIKKPDAKIIIFSNFRDMGAKIKDEIEEIKQVNSVLFVGQTKKRRIWNESKRTNSNTAKIPRRRL